MREVRQAARALEQSRGTKAWPQRALLERMVAQGRIRSYSQLVDEVRRLPVW